MAPEFGGEFFGVPQGTPNIIDIMIIKISSRLPHVSKISGYLDIKGTQSRRFDPGGRRIINIIVIVIMIEYKCNAFFYGYD